MHAQAAASSLPPPPLSLPPLLEISTFTVIEPLNLLFRHDRVFTLSSAREEGILLLQGGLQTLHLMALALHLLHMRARSVMLKLNRRGLDPRRAGKAEFGRAGRLDRLSVYAIQCGTLCLCVGRLGRTERSVVACVRDVDARSGRSCSLEQNILSAAS